MEGKHLSKRVLLKLWKKVCLLSKYCTVEHTALMNHLLNKEFCLQIRVSAFNHANLDFRNILAACFLGENWNNQVPRWKEGSVLFLNVILGGKNIESRKLLQWKERWSILCYAGFLFAFNSCFLQTVGVI